LLTRDRYGLQRSEFAKIPDLRRTAARCTASGTKHIVPATPQRPSLAYNHARKNHPPAKKGGEAPKGALFFQLPLTRLRATLEGALAFRRLTAAFTIGYHPDGSAPEPGFREARRPRCFAGSPHDASR
jgi:hypothetical protein